MKQQRLQYNWESGTIAWGYKRGADTGRAKKSPMDRHRGMK